MDEEDMQRRLAAVSAMTLSRWPDDELLVFNLAVLLQGRVPKENKAFSRAVEEKMCKDNGHLWDREALEMAIGAEMRRRFPEEMARQAARREVKP